MSLPQGIPKTFERYVYDLPSVTALNINGAREASLFILHYFTISIFLLMIAIFIAMALVLSDILLLPSVAFGICDLIKLRSAYSFSHSLY